MGGARRPDPPHRIWHGLPGTNRLSTVDQRQSRQRRKQQQKRLRWREDDEGPGDSSAEEQVTPTKYTINTRSLCRTTRVLPLPNRGRDRTL